jgi:hypothetical protein
MESLEVGAYRSASTERGCVSCSVVVFQRMELAERAGTTPVDLARSPLCREREPLTAPCSACGSDRVDRLILFWDGSREVTIEACGGCGLVVADRGDAQRLYLLLQRAEPMHRTL